MNDREIKFRAWDAGKMYEKAAVWLPFNPSVFDEERGFLECTETVQIMQYTGLKDKNGKEIYEGDVVEIRKDWKIFDEASRVIFSQYWGFQFYDMTFQDVFRDSNYDVRIIGNVFENPSLLK